MPRRTKIIATIGPASASPERLADLSRAGMDGARLNLSHGTHDEHRERARLVRATEAELGRPIALIADLQGPKLRIGELDGPVTLIRGDDIVVAGGERFDDGELPVSPAVISEVLQPGHEVLIDDGLVRLLEVDGKDVGKLEKYGQATRTGFPVSPGKHTVRVVTDAFDCPPREVEVKRGERLHLIVEIEDYTNARGGTSQRIAFR